MHVRKALMDDLDVIMEIYSVAQDFMIESGNPTQWGRTYPGRDLIARDIDDGVCHLVCEGDEVHGVFALFDGVEASYEYIEDGQWLNDEEYLTIHRIARDGRAHGILKCAVDYCKAISDNIRIDTHNSNLVMQRQIEKNVFKRCGTVYVRDGTSRIAYHWSRY